LIREVRHDPYRAWEKPPEPTVCEDCAAAFREGRWSWEAAPVDAARGRCPACRRIRDDYPGGYVTLRGSFVDSHRDEILGLARNVEEREKAQHPLKRIMRVHEDEDGNLEITTTDPHLARSLGEALHAAYAGELDYQYAKQESLVRVSWSR
jgi:NMD protein affecting ribosome stability and mRNA decay